MNDMKNYIKKNHLKLLIILILIFIVFQQFSILSNTQEYQSSSWDLWVIQSDLSEIKDRLGI
jgi:predicted negative regulator of RcsB-dependent stress response